MGGSFGLKGSAKLEKDGGLTINGAEEVVFQKSDVKSLAINDYAGKRFVFFGAPKRVIGIGLSDNKTVVLECTKRESDLLIDTYSGQL